MNYSDCSLLRAIYTSRFHSSEFFSMHKSKKRSVSLCRTDEWIALALPKNPDEMNHVKLQFEAMLKKF